MNPASTVIKRLGGEAAVAQALGTAFTAPYRWQYPRDKGGTGGTIPQKHHRKLIEFAASQGVELSAEDLLPPADDEPSPPSDEPASRELNPSVA